MIEWTVMSMLCDAALVAVIRLQGGDEVTACVIAVMLIDDLV